MKMKGKVFLVQTDTTVGFLCKNKTKLNKIKGRDEDRPCIMALSSLKLLHARIPTKYKLHVRRAKKTTFVLSNEYSFRIVKDENHKKFLDENDGWFYSTSANKTGKNFDIDFALKNADVVIKDKKEFFESKPSVIMKLGKKNIKKIR